MLSKVQIYKWLNKDLSTRLVITPILNPDVQINEGAVDVRLGTTFILTQKTEFPQMEATDNKYRLKENIEKYQFRVSKRFHEGFVLHPHQLVLGSTPRVPGLSAWTWRICTQPFLLGAAGPRHPLKPGLTNVAVAMITAPSLWKARRAQEQVPLPHRASVQPAPTAQRACPGKEPKEPHPGLAIQGSGYTTTRN